MDAPKSGITDVLALDPQLPKIPNREKKKTAQAALRKSPGLTGTESSAEKPAVES
jgi:hypothetical protein